MTIPEAIAWDRKRYRELRNWLFPTMQLMNQHTNFAGDNALRPISLKQAKSLMRNIHPWLIIVTSLDKASYERGYKDGRAAVGRQDSQNK